MQQQSLIVQPIEEEHVVLVDKNNHILGIAPKATVHTKDTPLHRAFSCFLFNHKGEVLLQQRSHKKKTWPLVWSNSCCGHPSLEETNSDAVKRRLLFELGITGVDPQEMLPTYSYRAERFGIVEHEICPVFVGYYDGDVLYNKEEVETIRWVPWHAFLEEMNQQPGVYSEWCEEESRLLQDLPLFRSFLENILR